ncbi:hypothetical protein [Halomonas nitroreducens]|uniref:Uncharacterized protein n=1 Tax=Halomonas nitroreducens TaxID=447425 RepID=A0A3S0JBQ4_9GAMM|nr:hypothetical protein [Halomonas nitroreducens]RTR05651.1 hypothetical protein EKG36_06045 [Halomonas nitroreducens]
MKSKIKIGESGRKGRILATSLLVGSVLASTSSLALTSAPVSGPGLLSGATHDIYYRGEVIPTTALDSLRGGFSLAGLEVNFGARLTTLINDRVRYETQLAFSQAGTDIISRRLDVAGGGAETLTQVGPETGVSVADITGQLNLAGLGGYSGVVLDDGMGGATAALHSITQNAIVSTLSTTASGQSIRNNIDVSVHILNAGELRLQRQRALILNSLLGAPR